MRIQFLENNVIVYRVRMGPVEKTQRTKFVKIVLTSTRMTQGFVLGEIVFSRIQDNTKHYQPKRLQSCPRDLFSIGCNKFQTISLPIPLYL